MNPVSISETLSGANNKALAGATIGVTASEMAKPFLEWVIHDGLSPAIVNCCNMFMPASVEVSLTWFGLAAFGYFVAWLSPANR